MPTDGQLEQYAENSAYVSPVEVAPPVGRILLMRRGEDLCTLRFTKFFRGKSTPMGLFTYGGASFYAEYEWQHLKLSNGNPVVTSIRLGNGKVSEKPGYGIGVLVFGAGTRKVVCGPFELRWHYPINVTFFEGAHARDYGIELAPTNWSKTSDLDLADPRLRWFGYNEQRRRSLIPIEDLPSVRR